MGIYKAGRGIKNPLNLTQRILTVPYNGPIQEKGSGIFIQTIDMTPRQVNQSLRVSFYTQITTNSLIVHCWLHAHSSKLY